MELDIVIESVIDKATKEINDVYIRMGGMTEKYVDVVRVHHEVMRDNTRTEAYKLQHFKESVDMALKLKKDWANAGLLELDKIEEKYKEVGQVEEVEEGSEIMQLKNVMLWKEILPTLDKEELKEYYIKHRLNDDFMALIRNIIKNDSDKKWIIDNLEAEYNKLSPLQELLKDERLKIRSLGQMGSSIFIIGEHGQIKEIRSIENDLRNVPSTLLFKI